MASADTRDGTSHGAVFAALAISIVLALGLAFYVYERYVRYVPRVAEHVPDDYAVALRLNVEQAVVYEPFRQHLLAMVEAKRASAPEGGQRNVSRLDALRDATTIELGVDLRELGIVLDRRGRWLVLLGGHFRQDGVVGGIARVLQREGISVERREGPERLVHGSGAAFAVTKDGVLLLAQSEALLLETLPPNADHPAFAPAPALCLRLGADDPGHLGGAVLEILPGQTFETDLVFPNAAPEVPDGALVEVLSGKTGDFTLLEGRTDWRFGRTPGGSRFAHTVLSRADFDRLVAGIAADLGRLLGLEQTQAAAP